MMSHVSALMFACLTLAGCSEPASSDSAGATSESSPTATTPSRTEQIAAAERKLAAEQAELNRLGKDSDAELAALKVPFEKYAAEIDPILAFESGPLRNNDPAAEKRIEEMKKQRSQRAQEFEKQSQDSRAKWEPRLAEQRARVTAAQAERDALLGIKPIAQQPPQPETSAKPLARVPWAVGTQSTIGTQSDSKVVQMDLKRLSSMTTHQYSVGESDGEGIGGGESSGNVPFIRLQYDGGDWDQDLKLNGDLNLLKEFHVQTGIPVAEQPESIEVDRLRNFKPAAAPPLVYLTGSKLIVLEKHEVKTLRDYLLDKHGLLLLDNGGGAFHQQAFAMMKQVVPDIEPVKVPLDDPIHAQPNELRGLPFVSTHGGRDAYGWKHKGRWICYYHPGDLGDAWSDGHAGVPKDVWQACYDLGVNIMHYAYAEQSKWRREQGIK